MSSKEQPSEQHKQSASNLSDEIASRIRQTIIGEGKATSDNATAAQKSTRFQKGQSGNPKGRPKKTASTIDLPEINPTDLPINATLLSILDKVFTVKSNNGGPDTQVTGLEALIQRIYKSSNDGNALSQKLIFEYALRLGKEVHLNNLKSFNFWQAYKDKKTKEIQAAIEAGQPEPVFYPHPDDVILEWPDKVTLTGPHDQASADKQEYLCQLREALMIQYFLDQRSECVSREKPTIIKKRSDPESALGKRSGSLILAEFINQRMVPRLRKQLDPSDREYLHYHRLNKRQLKPAIQKKWKESGINVRSGFVMPDTDKVKAALWEYVAAYKDWEGSKFQRTEEFVKELNEIVIDLQRS